jgi:hypothetical protein
VQIDNATKTTTGAPPPTLRQPTRTPAAAYNLRQTRGGRQDVYELSVSPPNKRAKLRDTRSTDEVPTNNPSSNRRSGLRSNNGSSNTINSTAGSAAARNQLRSAHSPRQRLPQPRVTKPTQQKVRSNTAADRVTGRTHTLRSAVNRSKTTKTASEEEGTGSEYLENSDQAGPSGDSDLEEQSRGSDDEDEDEGFETADEGDGEGREGARGGGRKSPLQNATRRERNSQPREDQDGLRRGNDHEEQNSAQDGDEFEQKPFSLHEQGANWRAIVEQAREIEEGVEGQPKNDWVQDLVTKVHQIMKDLKKISTRHDNSDHSVSRLEAQVDRNLRSVDDSLRNIPLAPVEKLYAEGMARFEAQISRLREIYSHAIPTLVLLLQTYLSRRFRGSYIKTAHLEQLVKLQDSTLHLCDQARKWNARVTVRNKTPKKSMVRDVNRLIKVPLKTIHAIFKEVLSRQKEKDEEEARQTRKEYEEERRRLREVKRAKYEHYLVESRDFFPGFMRSYKEGLRRSSVPDRPSASQERLSSSGTRHPMLANGPIPPFSLHKGTTVSDAGSVDQNTLRAKELTLEEDPWSEEEETYLIDALTQCKGTLFFAIWNSIPTLTMGGRG